MHRAWCLLLVAGCGKSKTSKLDPVDTSGVKLASPEDARTVAQELAKAMSRCDENQLAGFLDFAYLAARAGGSGAFLQTASKQKLSCSAPADHLSAIVLATSPDRPILRWRKGSGCIGSFGYMQLTVEAASPAPRIADFDAPLHPQTAVTSLRDIKAVPPEDQPGMVEDVFFSPFEGIETASQLVDHLADPARDASVKTRPQDVDQAISYAFRRHDYAAAKTAADAAAKIVGEDAPLAAVRVAAALGAGDPASAQKLAREATTTWPDDLDAWCARYDAERAAGDATALAEAKQTLATKFKVER